MVGGLRSTVWIGIKLPLKGSEVPGIRRLLGFLPAIARRHYLWIHERREG